MTLAFKILLKKKEKVISKFKIDGFPMLLVIDANTGKIILLKKFLKYKFYYINIIINWF
jgi:hypothetical protein